MKQGDTTTLYQIIPQYSKDREVHPLLIPDPVGEFRKVVWCKTHDSSLDQGSCLWLEVTEEQIVYNGPKCVLVEVWMGVV